MTKKIRFYNRDGNWYADLPEYIEAGGTEEDCQMVFGADDFLDKLCEDRNMFYITLSDNEISPNYLIRTEYNDYGAYYKTYLPYQGYAQNLWLCPVTLFLFREYPEKIYYIAY